MRFQYLLVLLFLYRLFCVTNGMYIINNRMIRSPAKATPTGGFVITSVEPSVVGRKSKKQCGDGTNNGVVCTPSSLNITWNTTTAAPKSNSSIIGDIFEDLKKGKFLCLDYGHGSTDVEVGLKYYDSETEICCNGLYNRTKPTLQCCNGDIIDGETELCCGDHRVPKSKASGCCKNTQYDTDTTLCCNGTLHQRTKYSACCEDRVISKITEICCGGRVYRKSPLGDTEECCGGALFNTRTKVCCGGRMLPKIGEDNSYRSCCQNKSYDIRCFTCTPNFSLIPTFNNTENSTCCHGQFMEDDNGNVVCCTNGSTESICQQLYEQSTVFTATLQTGSHGSAKKHEVQKDVVIAAVCSSCIVIAVGVVLIMRFKKRFRRSVSLEEKLLSPDQTTETVRNTMDDLNFSTQITNKPVDGRSMASSCLNVSMPVTDEEFDAFIAYDNDDVSTDGVLTTIPDVVGNQNVDDLIKIISKGQPSYTGNELKDHFIDKGCQTVSKENSCNRRTVFGFPFEHSRLVDLKDPIFIMPHSEVQVRLPDSLLQHSPVEMHGTSFDSIRSITSKFNIPDSEQIASPAVEYLLTGVKSMDDYAVVRLPFLGPQEDLKVWKFISDDGMQTKVDPFEVPRKTAENGDMPLYYIVEGQHVKIFTKTFSGFFNTTRKHNRNSGLSLRTFLYGSYKRFKSPFRHEIRLVLYIADELMKFEDYGKRMENNEERQGRRRLVEKPLELTGEVKETDFLRSEVIVENEYELWTHKLNPRTGEPILPMIKETKFDDIVQKCEDCPNCHFKYKEVPLSVEWYLVSPSASGQVPSEIFNCLVNVDCIHVDADTHRTQPNVIIVDELPLRPSDRYPVMECDGGNRLGDLETFLIHMEEAHQERFVEKIKAKNDCRGERIPEIFQDLRRKMRTVGIFEATVAALHYGGLFKEVDALKKTGILEDGFFPKPVQRTEIDSSEQNFRAGVPRAISSNQRNPIHQSIDQSNIPRIGHAEGRNLPEEQDLLTNIPADIPGTHTRTDDYQGAVGFATSTAADNNEKNNLYLEFQRSYADHLAAAKCDNFSQLTAREEKFPTDYKAEKNVKDCNREGAHARMTDLKVTEDGKPRGYQVRGIAKHHDAEKPGYQPDVDNQKSAGESDKDNQYPATREIKRDRKVNESRNTSEAAGADKNITKGHDVCRNELGSDLPVHSYPRDVIQDSTSNWVQFSDNLNAEHSDRLQLTELKYTFPVQEHASHDETLLKQASDSDSDDE